MLHTAFTEMYNGIDEWFEAEMAPSICFVIVSGCAFGCVELAPILHVWLAIFAHFDVHIAMDFR